MKMYQVIIFHLHSLIETVIDLHSFNIVNPAGNRLLREIVLSPFQETNWKKDLFRRFSSVHLSTKGHE